MDLRLAKAFPERLAIAKARMAQNDRTTVLLDPLPIDVDLRKYHYIFKDGMRVKIAHPLANLQSAGHLGTILDAHDPDAIHVRLDSGHQIHAMASELEPEHFGYRSSDLDDPDADDSEAKFMKSAHKTFRVGQKVRKRAWPLQVGTIVKAADGRIEAKFESGPVECTAEYAQEILESVTA